eukprot:GEMP01061569.1.p1 GENE.GEMP01061569.1~~GEMP01061569.1.p1  ORF type:complete len:148 (+),score=30.16 GEMP01061569.1:268-711(+)
MEPTAHPDERPPFTINWMNMRDADTGDIIWESDGWDVSAAEVVARIPKSILRCRRVSREINFSSVNLMNKFRLEQTVMFKGLTLEEWDFYFGFVIPNSTNSWQQTIEAADEGEMLPPELLSGNVVMETTFYDGDNLVLSQKIRLFYV